MEVYTFIMDYLGGTYISQIEANDIKNAMHKWIKDLLVEEIEGFTENDRRRIIEDNFIDEEPTLLNGLSNTWHFLVLTKKGTGFVNFVKTKV
jgi:hypothetical protein